MDSEPNPTPSWLKKISDDMKYAEKGKGKYTVNYCVEDLRPIPTPSWLKRISDDMKNAEKGKGKYTVNYCVEDLRPYPTPSSCIKPIYVKPGGKRYRTSPEKGEDIDQAKYIRISAEDGKDIECIGPFENKTILDNSFRELNHANNYCKAAFLELMTLAKEADTWIHALPALGNLDDLVNEFRTPPPPGKKIELSVATAVVPGIRPFKMVNLMMDVENEWSKSLFPLVTKREKYGVLDSLENLSMADATFGTVVRVHAEMQLPSTLVPARYFEFLRYSKEVEYGGHVIVDFSSNHFATPPAKSNSKKRPSGVIIREDIGTYGGCEIILIENVEVDETIENNMYSGIINSTMAFGAHRCISTLLRNLKRDKSSFTGHGRIDLDRTAGSFLLSLTESMKRFFMECVSQHPDDDVVTVESSAEDPIRILHNKTTAEDLTFVGVASFRVQTKPLSVLQLLMEKDIKLEFRVLTGTETDEINEVLEQVVTFSTDYNIISLHKGELEEEIAYILQEASIDEHCSFILSQTLDKGVVDFHIAGGVESIFDESEANMNNMTPIGFAIMPDGPRGLECDACLVTFLRQIYDPCSIHVNVESVRQEFVIYLNDVIQELNEKVVKEEGKMTELF